MDMKSFKARVLRALRSLPRAAAAISRHSPAATSRVIRVYASGDGFLDAGDAPKQPEAIDAWELVPSPAAEEEQEGPTCDPLQEFPANCPPGGEDAVVLYTTTLRGIRKTFEDCNRVRSLLENLTVGFQERDVSMDQGFRDELWAVLGGKAAPPRLFVRGLYLGGGDEVVGLHEEGRLAPLLRLAAAAERKAGKCAACGGARFVVCGECNGSRKVFHGRRGVLRCPECNENGLVMCPLCS